ncbi:MAG: carboxypeptidase regulatory-like domain-containing protein, partial [Planctomycetes bacterium]|nr:carboxypeptidase regulatory-like domain-containing protein [Planctomycetota bacterium]
LASLCWWLWPREPELAVTPSAPAAAPAGATPVVGAAPPLTADVTAPVQREPLRNEPLLLHGTLTRLGGPAPGRTVQLFAEVQLVRQTTTDAQGRWAFEVAPGSHRLAVPFVGVTEEELTTFPYRGHRHPPLAAALVQDAEVTDASVFVALTLPTGAITVRALTASTALPVAGANVALRYGMHELLTTTDAAGIAHFEDLDPMNHSLTVSARGFEVFQDGIELDALNPRRHLDAQLTPVGAFDLRLLDDVDAPVEISAAMSAVVTDLSSDTPVVPSNIRELRDTPRPKVLRFDDLQAGRFRIALRDEECGEKILRYLPVDATDPIEVDIPAGAVTPIDLHVRYRAYVRLRAHDRSGAMGDGVLAVERLDEQLGTLRILPAPWQRGSRSGDTHFDGYLAPGTYALTFTSGERQYRDTLVVTRENVDRTLTLPW